jgi:hypothetical protein
MKKLIGFVLAGIIGLVAVSAVAETDPAKEAFVKCMTDKCGDQVATCLATENCADVVICTSQCDTLDCVKTKCVPMVKTEATRLAVVGFLKCRAANCNK